MRQRLLVPIFALVASACATAPEPASARTSPPPMDRMAAAQENPRAALVRALDSIARAPVEAGRVAGLSVAVVHGSDTLLLRGYGRADLELDVPTPQGAVYEIASVTKQFTAAAVLKLAQEGKLRLDDELTRYLPDYPTQGHRVTIRHLLDHTSGIRSYTGIPAFWEIAPRSLPRDTLVDLIAAEPFDFAPGEAMIYSDSGYFLLGLVIEAASGMSYEDFVEESILAPLGMARSRYCSNTEVIEGRARGYHVNPAGAFVRAPYVNHYWLSAGGGLCSTAGDLITWMRALHGGRVLGAAVYQEMITPEVLSHGHRLRYAKGLGVLKDAAGHGVIRHSGGLPGFLSEARYYPEQDLYVIVLINTTGHPHHEAVADALAERVLGPGDEPQTVTYPGDLEGLFGSYRGPARGGPMTVRVERGEDGLLARMGEDDEPKMLRYIGENTFASEHWRFMLEQRSDRINALHVDVGSGHYVLPRKDGVPRRAMEDR